MSEQRNPDPDAFAAFVAGILLGGVATVFLFLLFAWAHGGWCA